MNVKIYSLVTKEARFMKKFLLCLMLLALCVPAFCEEEIITLPAPDKTGGLPVMEALALRKSSRNFRDTELAADELSALLWAAGGVNRPDGKLVYPTAMNARDLIIFAFTKSAVYRYNPEPHTLTVIERGDYRSCAAVQDFGAKAAVNLVYVQDSSRWPKIDATPEQVRQAGFAHTGFSMQNVYLYAVSQGWGARAVMSMNYEKLPELLKLTKTQALILAQCVGPLD